MRLRRHTAAIALATICATSFAAPPVVADPKLIASRLDARVSALFDSTRRGWITKDGRPAESAVELALAVAGSEGDSRWRQRALSTIDFTRTLLDTVGGGFLESADDADPMKTSFSKTTVSNARRFELWLDAQRIVRDPRLAKESERIADYFERVLLDGRGGFVAGQIGDRELIPEANGVAIHAWLRWAADRGDAQVRDFAWKSLDRVWETCWNQDFGMMRRGVFGEVLAYPQLVDQVEIGRAYVLAAHFGGRRADLERARLVADHMLKLFEVPERGGFRTQARLDKKGRVKNAARVPGENARAARFLMELSAVSGEPRYREAAERAVTAFADEFEKAGYEAADWALALRAESIDALPEQPTFRPAKSDRKPDRRKNPVAKGSRG